MKKSKYINLVLISAALASCDRQLRNTYDGEITSDVPPDVYMRSDTTVEYVPAPVYNNSFNLWFYAFRPYYGYYNQWYFNDFCGWPNFNYYPGGHSWKNHGPGYYHGNLGSGPYHYGPRTTTTGGFGHRSGVSGSHSAVS